LIQVLLKKKLQEENPLKKNGFFLLWIIPTQSTV